VVNNASSSGALTGLVARKNAATSTAARSTANAIFRRRLSAFMRLYPFECRD
jgi:hypothetical protein